MTITRVSGGYMLPRFEQQNSSDLTLSDFGRNVEKARLRSMYLRAMNDGVPRLAGSPHELSDASLANHVSFEILRNGGNVVEAYRLDNAFYAKQTRSGRHNDVLWYHIGPWPETRH